MPPNATSLACAALLVMLLQPGFALVTTGLCRAKNAGQLVVSNLMINVGAILGFWICGFAFLSGGVGPSHHEWAPKIFGHPFGLLGGAGFFFGSQTGGAASLLFLLQAVALAAAAVIPAGAMAERWSFRNVVLYGFWVGALPLAIFGHWVWGGGWLAQLGQNSGLGHGAVDFAGCSVLHLAAGVIALAGATALGPRLGKYARDGRPRPLPGHNLIYVVVGALLLSAGFIALNVALPFPGSGEQIGAVCVNTLLAAAAGAFAAYAATVVKFGKPDPSMICNGLLSGLVAIAASCPFVNSTAAVFTGAVAGVVVVHGVLFLEGRLKIDDPVGAISVHGLSGLWGLLALGLFANGAAGAGWNGVHTLVKAGAVKTVFDDPSCAQLLASGWTEAGVAGAFGKIFGSPLNDWSQLGAQCLCAFACLLFVGAFAFLWFKISGRISPLRSRRDIETRGLDLPETGAECYPDFHLNDQGGSTSG